MIWYSSSRRGLTKLKHGCASAPTCEQRTYTENGRKSTKKVTEEDEESADDASAEIGKSNAKQRQRRQRNRRC